MSCNLEPVARRAAWATRLAACAVLALVPLACAPAASGHDVFEAQELEVHAINDEGTDAIEPYGGYDITEAFLGSAYVPGTGDAIYVRLELYGILSDTNGAMPWRVEVSYDADAGRQTHFLQTEDGTSFTHDFADLAVKVEGSDTHVERAILPAGGGLPKPGELLRGLEVRSYWGTDLRDIAPGGIPLPFSQGAADLPDPTAIPGKGRLSEGPIPTTDAYVGALAASFGNGTYTLQAQNGLKSGGQHLRLLVPATAGWDAKATKAVQVLAGNATGTFEFQAHPEAGTTAPLPLELTSDIGGRLLLELAPDGTLTSRGAVLVTAQHGGDAQAPAPVAALVAATLAGLAALARRGRKDA